MVDEKKSKEMKKRFSKALNRVFKENL